MMNVDRGKQLSVCDDSCSEWGYADNGDMRIRMTRTQNLREKQHRTRRSGSCFSEESPLQLTSAPSVPKFTHPDVP